MKKCKARRVNDELVCHDCGLRWDVTDPDRPDCAPRNIKGSPKDKLAAGIQVRKETARAIASEEDYGYEIPIDTRFTCR